MNKKDFFLENNIAHVDYKAIPALRQFINKNGRMLSRKVTGLTAKNQRSLSQAIKRARFMGLLPYLEQ